MANQRDGKKKQRDGKKPPTPPRGPVNRASNSLPSEEIRKDDQAQTKDNVSENATVKLTRALVWWTGVLAIATIGLGAAAFCQLRALESTDHHIAQQLTIMHAGQRAWVSLEVEIAGSLAYDDKGWDTGTRWHIPLSYRLQNLGETPATNVSFFGEIIPFIIPHFPPNKIKDGIRQGTPEPGTDIESEFEKVCSFPEQMAAHNMGWGQVLFPNERWPQDGKKRRIFGMNGNPAVFESAKINAGYTGQFLVVVCATYGSTLSEDKYRTAKAFFLFKPDGSIDLTGEIVPEGVLGFELSPTNGSYAR